MNKNKISTQKNIYKVSTMCKTKIWKKKLKLLRCFMKQDCILCVCDDGWVLEWLCIGVALDPDSPIPQWGPVKPFSHWHWPLMHWPRLLQVGFSQVLAGMSHSAPFQPSWHTHTPWRYSPWPLQRCGHSPEKCIN